MRFSPKSLLNTRNSIYFFIYFYFSIQFRLTANNGKTNRKWFFKELTKKTGRFLIYTVRNPTNILLDVYKQCSHVLANEKICINGRVGGRGTFLTIPSLIFCMIAIYTYCHISLFFAYLNKICIHSQIYNISYTFGAQFKRFLFHLQSEL